MDVFFSLGVHVHEEVEEAEDLSMDVSDGDCIGTEMEVNVVVVSDHVYDFLEGFAVVSVLFEKDQYVLDHKDLQVASHILDVVFQEIGVTGRDVLVYPSINHT